MKSKKVNIYPILPAELNGFLQEQAEQKCISENQIIKMSILDLQEGKINMEELRRLSY